MLQTMLKTLMLIISSFYLCALHAQDGGSLSPNQQTEVKQIIKNYLSNQQNLIALVGNIKNAELQQQSDERGKIAQAHAQEIFFPHEAITGGNPNGKITLVEFFDYLCPYCRKEVHVIDELIAKNPNLRVVFRQLPIHGAPASLSANYAVAAAKLGKFMVAHHALMKNDKFDTQGIQAALTNAGIDMNKIKETLKGTYVSSHLTSDLQVAQELQIPYTPFLILAPVQRNADGSVTVGKIFFPPPGSSFKDLQQLIDQLSHGK